MAVSPTAVSLALIREEDCIQLPIYYTNRALRGVKGRYPLVEKLAFALIMTAQKLRPYFQAHTIVVQMDKPLFRAMNNQEAVGQLVLWAVELDEFDILYRPRIMIKA